MDDFFAGCLHENSRTLAAQRWWMNGVVGQCLVLDGDKDHIGVFDSSSLSFTPGTFSLSVWVTVYMLDRGQQMIAAKNIHAADQREWSLMVDTDNLNSAVSFARNSTPL